MKNVLIASTYYENCSGKNILIPNEVWLDLQTKFIKKNTNNYDFAVFLNTVKNKSLFKDCIIIGENNVATHDGRLSHRKGLRASIEYFRQHQSEYDAFCILDCDCFPIRKGWIKDIKKILRDKKLKFAAIVRLENGEDFPHPSGIIIPSEHINEDIFHFPTSVDYFACKNIIDGTPISDTGSNMTFWAPNEELMGHPLVRSNVINLHPVYAGIYGDMLYHHGLGSRVKNNAGVVVEPDKSYRSRHYWHIHGKHYCQDFGLLFDMIKESPQKFIDNLRGEELIKSNKFMTYFSKPQYIAEVVVPIFKT